MRRILVLSWVLLGMMALVRAQEPGAHPRLLMRAGEEPKGVTEGLFKAADSVIVSFSRKTLKQPPVERTMIGRRLLHTSRTVLKRTFWLGYTYRVHGGEAYARRRAIIDKGLKPAGNKADAWFYRNENNWNSVCNAGMVYGALAVWEEDPEFCQSMLEKSLESNKLAYKAYAGGGYPEGYNYWGYGASFQIMLEAALDRAFKDGYVRSPEAEAGLAALVASADFIRFTRTPADHSYSFSDSYRRADGQYMQAWIFRHTGDASFLYPELRYMEASGYRRLCEDRLFPMFLIALGGDAPERIGPPEGRYYQCGGTTPVFVYRSGWESQEDDYLGVKGGLAMSSHSHLDQGSFYFESDGVTWATDLGMQDYNSLESKGVDLWDMLQDSERWTVFRIGPFSHNILTVNGKVPKVNQVIDFLRTRRPDTPRRRGAVPAADVRRRPRLLPAGSALRRPGPPHRGTPPGRGLHLRHPLGDGLRGRSLAAARARRTRHPAAKRSASTRTDGRIPGPLPLAVLPERPEIRRGGHASPHPAPLAHDLRSGSAGCRWHAVFARN